MTTLQVYRSFAGNMYGGYAAGTAYQIDYLSDTVKATLHTSTYVPNANADQLYADATNELATANGYTNGGATIGGKTITGPTANVTTIGSAAFSWTAAGGSLVFRYVVIRDSTIGSGPLIGYLDCGAQTITTGNTFTVDPTGSGLFTVTVA